MGRGDGFDAKRDPMDLRSGGVSTISTYMLKFEEIVGVGALKEMLDGENSYYQYFTLFL